MSDDMTAQQTHQQISDLLSQGKTAQALKKAKIALKKFPDLAPFHTLVGLALAQDGQHRQAVPHFTRAVSLAPQDAALQVNLVQALVFSGQHARAEELIARFSKGRPPSADLLYLHAMSRGASGSPQDALAFATRAIEARPDAPRAYPLRITASLALNRIDDALEDYRTLATLSPHDATPLLDMAVTLIRAFRPAEAHVALDRALARDDRNPAVHNALGMLAMMEGRDQDAVRHYRAVLTLQPDQGEAHLQLSRLIPASDAPELRNAVTRAIAGQPSGTHNLALLHFARANLHRLDKATPDEIEDLRRANRIESGLRPYDRKAALRAFTTLTECAAPPAPIRTDLPVPVFVVGLPRSGTTLLERILSSHDTVFGCGELGAGGALAAQAETDAFQFDPVAFAETYRAALPTMPAGTTHFVDKLPANYKLLGPLRAAFPNARFVLLHRDPRDVALSMWRNYFAQSGLNYAFDQKAMAFEFNLFRQYVTHWQDRLGADLLALSYEDVVADVETASRTLADFIAVPWQPDMASPHRNTGSVQTVSSTQVRQAVHQGAVRGWQRAEPALRVLISNLDPALWPELQ